MMMQKMILIPLTIVGEDLEAEDFCSSWLSASLVLSDEDREEE